MCQYLLRFFLTFVQKNDLNTKFMRRLQLAFIKYLMSLTIFSSLDYHTVPYLQLHLLRFLFLYSIILPPNPSVHNYKLNLNNTQPEKIPSEVCFICTSGWDIHLITYCQFSFALCSVFLPLSLISFLIQGQIRHQTDSNRYYPHHPSLEALPY